MPKMVVMSKIAKKRKRMSCPPLREVRVGTRPELKGGSWCCHRSENR